MIGLWLLLTLGLLYVVYAVGHNRGLVASHHICRTDPIIPGLRYQATQLKYVDVSCMTCFELIPAQILVKRTFKASDKLEPYTVELDLTDYKFHATAHNEPEKPNNK